MPTTAIPQALPWVGHTEMVISFDFLGVTITLSGAASLRWNHIIAHGG